MTALEPGYRQGRGPAKGLETGRQSPRVPVRDSARSQILNAHGIAPIHPNQVWTSEGRGYDPNQGSLFDVNEVSPRPSHTPQDGARAVGAPTGDISVKGGPAVSGMAGRPGFMPGLTRKQKISGLQNLKEARIASGADRGGGAMAESIADRMSALGNAEAADWYHGVDPSTGKNSPDILGHAPAAIQHAATNPRLGGVSTSALTRATAMTSPQAGWMDENTGELPNLNGAKRAVSTVNRSRTSRRYNMDPTAEQVGARAKEAPVPGGVLPESMKKAALNYHAAGDNASAPYPIQDRKSLKAANFELALQSGHQSQDVRRIASDSWTVDRHDARSIGVDADSPPFKRVGTYEAVAHSGKTAALKTGMLNADAQSGIWKETKRHSSGNPSDAPRLFDPNNGNKLNNDAVAQSPSSRNMNRSATAQKYDLEF